MAFIPRQVGSDNLPADIRARLSELLELPPDAASSDVPRPNTILFLSGPPGAGKSRIVETIQAEAERAGVACARHDFTLVENFRTSQIEQSIQRTLTQHNQDYATFFKEYTGLRDRLRILRVSINDFSTQQDRTRDEFVSAYNQAAALEQRQGRPFVLLFDSAEYAADLYDPALKALAPGYQEANWGGEYWLTSQLGELQNTITIISGCTESPFQRDEQGKPVAVYYYDQARLKLQPDNRFNTMPLVPDEAQAYLHELFEQIAEHPGAARIAHQAKTLELASNAMKGWIELAQGSPFWLGVCLTAALLGYSPPAEADDDASVGARRHRSTALMWHLFVDPSVGAADDLLVVLRWMVHLRKGLTLALLKHLLARQSIQADAAKLFAELQALPLINHSLNDGQLTISLHDEVAHTLGSGELAVPAELVVNTIAWYDQRLQEAVDEQGLITKQILGGEEAHGGDDLTRLQVLRAQKLDRRHQIELDRMAYFFALDYERGLKEHNVMAYNAIIHRNYGFNITIRQEGLRNFYQRHRPDLPPELEIESAAFWMMRAAHSDPRYIRQLRERLGAYNNNTRLTADGRYRQQLAFLRLAEAQAIHQSYASVADRAGGTALLERAAAEIPRLPNGDEEAIWEVLLHSQIEHWRGVYFEEHYQYQDAIARYRASLDTAARYPLRSRGLRALTASYLAGAYAEQGEIEDGRRIGQEALLQLQRLAWDYQLAFGYLIQARIEMRAGRSLKALKFARPGINLLRDIGSDDRLIDALLILAEAQRKVAEDRDDDRDEQIKFFKEAFDTVSELETQIEALSQDEAKEQRQQLASNVSHLRGCLHRSKAVMYQQIGNDRRAQEEYAASERYLRQASTIAEQNHLPPLVQIDIHEDLAAVLVNMNPADETIDQLIDRAEGFVDMSYRLDEEFGLRDVALPVNAFWRELGQVELQRMLLAFRRQRLPQYAARRNELLDKAGEHLLKMFAYLLKYARASWMLSSAEGRVLRELMRQSESDLRLVTRSVLRTARRFHLENSDAQRLVEELIRIARRDRSILAEPRPSEGAP